MLGRNEVDEAKRGVSLDSHCLLLGRNVNEIVSTGKAILIKSLDQHINGCQLERKIADHQCSIGCLKCGCLVQTVRRHPSVAAACCRCGMQRRPLEVRTPPCGAH